MEGKDDDMALTGGDYLSVQHRVANSPDDASGPGAQEVQVTGPPTLRPWRGGRRRWLRLGEPLPPRRLWPHKGTDIIPTSQKSVISNSLQK
jgi:hypothetical protein